MGVCINHKIGIPNKKNVIRTLDKAESVARAYASEGERLGVPFIIDRIDPQCLRVDVKGCETLMFNFKTVAELTKDKATGEYSYEWAVLTNDGKKDLYAGYEVEKYPSNEMYYSADFCKTQFAGDLFAHKAIAELIRVVAGRASYAEISDEGDYYYTGDINDAGRAIQGNQAMIDGLVGQLKDAGWQGDQIITPKREI